MNISIFFGGNNDERGISINSARACFDIIKNHFSDIKIYYVDHTLKVIQIDAKHLYSNTPEDFLFLFSPIKDFWRNFTTDYAIPLIHGVLGEDGVIQAILEKKQIPFLFSGSSELSDMFIKTNFCNILSQNNFHQWHSILYENNIYELELLHKKHSQIILKPYNGGSSINVFVSDSMSQSLEIIAKYPEIKFICEEKHTGKEFSIAVIDGKAQIPVQIDHNNDIFDYRCKYFPTEEIELKTPPDFSLKIIQQIQIDTERVFNIFNARDCIRIDGWVLNNGKIIYTECNPISSIEFNSLFFQSIPQNPKEAFLQILNNSFERYNFPKINDNHHNKLNIPIIFGGNSSEKEISLLSGSNVTIKLLNSNKYYPVPYFLNDDKIYKIPIHMLFKHTLKDLMYTIENIEQYNQIAGIEYVIECMNLEGFLQTQNIVFSALHGGIGEDGTLQKLYEKYNVVFNGSNAEVSELCMNKLKTALLTESLPEITKINRYLIESNVDINILPELSKGYILKPNCEGSSTGVIAIFDKNKLLSYLNSINSQDQYFVDNGQKIKISPKKQLLLEEMIIVDQISVHYVDGASQISYSHKTGWVELTVGVIGKEILEPSITLASGIILTAEEKFQEGTGINITPPPEFIISTAQKKYIQLVIKKICDLIGIDTYARLDIFFNRDTNEFILIEINTLPGLTYSTVIFQQYVYNGRKPEELIENLIDLSILHKKKHLKNSNFL